MCGGSEEKEVCSWSITRPHAYKKISARVVRTLEVERESDIKCVSERERERNIVCVR